MRYLTTALAAMMTIALGAAPADAQGRIPDFPEQCSV